MKKFAVVTLMLFAVAALPGGVLATNGDNLIAIGPIARSMGGVGIAYPLDAISAVFANPAAMCFGIYCPSAEVNFAGTLFMPQVEAKITSGGQTIQADSDEKVYAIPAIGLSLPIGSGPSNWRFGLAAYGVTGLGVDYRGTNLDQPGFYDFSPFGGPQFPLASGEYTQLQIMKFSPAVAFQPNARLSLGLGLQIDYASLDLREGASFNYGIGAQLGAIYKPLDALSLGLTYTSPQSVDHDNVTDLDGDGRLDTLTLEAPQQLGFGAAYEFVQGKILVEADVKWLNWSSADGYDDFDWDDQWVFGIGAQFKPMDQLALRVGYNYGANPVNEHNGWDGSVGPTGPNSFTTVQGKRIPTYYYETFRTIGFPAVVEHHLTFGAGYQFTPNLILDLGFMYAFENSVTENGTNLFGQPVNIESTLKETSIDFGITWRF